MKKSLIITASIVAVILLAGAGWYYTNFNKYAPESYVTENENGTSTTINTSTGTETPGSPTITKAEVSAHKDAASCYSIISGSVYDLTMWVNMHPGGKGPILSLCGTDGTDRFMNKHKGAARYMTILARYKIGTLGE